MRIIVIGLGYVGSVNAAGLAKIGHQVTGIDINYDRIYSFRNGFSNIKEPGLTELIAELMKAKRLEIRHVSETDHLDYQMAMICVGTPAQLDGAADLTQVLEAVNRITLKAVNPITVIMKSTVPPGTGQQIMNQYLNNSKIKHTYVTNPEFLREGQAVYDWFHPDRTVIGSASDSAIEQMRELYKNRESPFLITDVITAEIIKYASNAFLATKISFINEIARLCEQTGGNIETVARV